MDAPVVTLVFWAAAAGMLVMAVSAVDRQSFMRWRRLAVVGFVAAIAASVFELTLPALSPQDESSDTELARIAGSLEALEEAAWDMSAYRGPYAPSPVLSRLQTDIERLNAYLAEADRLADPLPTPDSDPQSSHEVAREIARLRETVQQLRENEGGGASDAALFRLERGLVQVAVALEELADAEEPSFADVARQNAFDAWVGSTIRDVGLFGFALLLIFGVIVLFYSRFAEKFDEPADKREAQASESNKNGEAARWLKSLRRNLDMIAIGVTIFAGVTTGAAAAKSLFFDRDPFERWEERFGEQLERVESRLDDLEAREEEPRPQLFPPPPWYGRPGLGASLVFGRGAAVYDVRFDTGEPDAPRIDGAWPDGVEVDRLSSIANLLRECAAPDNPVSVVIFGYASSSDTADVEADSNNGNKSLANRRAAQTARRLAELTGDDDDSVVITAHVWPTFKAMTRRAPLDDQGPDDAAESEAGRFTEAAYVRVDRFGVCDPLN